MERVLYTFWQFVSAGFLSGSRTETLVQYFHSSSPALFKGLHAYGLLILTVRVRPRPKWWPYPLSWPASTEKSPHTSLIDVKENVGLLKMRKWSSLCSSQQTSLGLKAERKAPSSLNHYLYLPPSPPLAGKASPAVGQTQNELIFLSFFPSLTPLVPCDAMGWVSVGFSHLSFALPGESAGRM